MRVALAIVAAAAVAFVAAVILGEYAFVGVTPWAAGLVVPLAVAETCALAAGRRPAWLWPFAAVTGSGGVAWGVWLSMGRGLDPWPSGGSIAVALALVWPVAVGAALRRRHTAGVS
ncbi:hypothetical protein K6U06_22430 [Acidiferrimicrobium sp. IK]|uniref:hypothetical protein n=1 Tax=Acidiferrimicrobium sp. IK TaxID=2871700 RepID=UPI0021CAFC90|nr:hypothetical protein [Acidiferrimicrobium sp. IK]MCU4187136.1 hypothetical protein [Acidiferrimicrobium sp. IK]